MEKLIETFKAKGDNNGSIYTAHIFQRMIAHRPISGPPANFGGNKRAALSDGRSLNWVDDSDDVFQIVQTDEIIRRIS